jgi:hypothetical protein
MSGRLSYLTRGRRFRGAQGGARPTGQRVRPGPLSASIPFSGGIGSTPRSRSPCRRGTESRGGSLCVASGFLLVWPTLPATGGSLFGRRRERGHVVDVGRRHRSARELSATIPPGENGAPRIARRGPTRPAAAPGLIGHPKDQRPPRGHPGRSRRTRGASLPSTSSSGEPSWRRRLLIENLAVSRPDRSFIEPSPQNSYSRL